jgi:hypothetical protein
MPIPPLNIFGVLPTGRHDCTLQEIAVLYCSNPGRDILWQGFLAFLAWMQAQPPPKEILVDGSFTSDKESPDDIDVVFDLSGCSTDARNHWITIFMTQEAWLKAQFRVDFWVYFPGAPNDLRAFFEYVRPEEAIRRGMPPGELKGLLRIVS